MSRRTKTTNTLQPRFVVYVRFPSSDKEYCYNCSFPVNVGDEVIANGTRVRVHRIAAWDTIASRSVLPAPDRSEILRRVRLGEVTKRLRQLEESEMWAARFAKLKSPEAKKLVAELKRLQS